MSLEDIQRKAAEAARNAQANLNNAESEVNSQIAEAQNFIQARGVDTSRMEFQFENNTFHLGGTVETGEQLQKLAEVTTNSGSTSAIVNNVELEDLTPRNIMMKVVTKGSNLNVRGGAGTDHDVVGKFPNGSQVQIVKKPQSDWYHVKSNDVEGYCHTNFLKEI